MNNAQQKRFFQNCLYDALMQLMQEKPFEKISIGALCDRAGVSRMTYYRSYNCKEDILLQHLDECFSEFSKDLQVQDFYKVALSFFVFWQYKERDFLVAVIRSGLSAQLMDKFYGYLDQIVPQIGEHTYIKSFLAGGLYKMLLDWMRDGMKTPPEELAAFLAAGSRVLTQI